MYTRIAAFGVLMLTSVVSLAGCGRSDSTAAPPPTGSPAAQPASPAAPPSAAPAAPVPAAAASPAAAPTGTPIASGTYSANPSVRCDLLEVRRVSGGALLVRWRTINTAGASEQGSLSASSAAPIYYDFNWADLYYLDPAENKKYSFLTDSEGNRILDVYFGNLKPGEQRVNWAKFPAPPAGSTKISLTLPKFPPFEDVPVTP